MKASGIFAPLSIPAEPDCRLARAIKVLIARVNRALPLAWLSMRAPIQLDLHLPNFNYPGVGPEAVFERLVDIATTAERAGFSSVTLMDHYHQIPPVGPPENWMFEGNTMLAGLAARTETIALGLLVGGVTYRNPAQHAKITTTLDIISGGRAFHGIGAGWFEEEHDAYGYAFPPLKERFERLEDHLRIARAMFTEEQATVAGEHHSVTRRLQQPEAAARRHPDPRSAAAASARRCGWSPSTPTAATCSATPSGPGTCSGAARATASDVGRDPAEITKTSMMTIVIAERRTASGPSSTRCAPPGSEARIAATTGHPTRSSSARTHSATSASRA